jgi:hypothetical protein
VGVDIEVVGLEALDQILEGQPQIRQEAVVLLGDGFRQDLLAFEQVGEVDVEGGELKVLHAVDLVDVVGLRRGWLLLRVGHGRGSR